MTIVVTKKIFKTSILVKPGNIPLDVRSLANAKRLTGGRQHVPLLRPAAARFTTPAILVNRTGIIRFITQLQLSCADFVLSEEGSGSLINNY